jgi:hypothetical protein
VTTSSKGKYDSPFPYLGFQSKQTTKHFFFFVKPPKFCLKHFSFQSIQKIALRANVIKLGIVYSFTGFSHCTGFYCHKIGKYKALKANIFTVLQM